jgi:hypothetical protein
VSFTRQNETVISWLVILKIRTKLISNYNVKTTSTLQ